MSDITRTDPAADRGPISPTLRRDTRQHLGRQLQVVFAEVEGEPLPTDHIDLLLALRRKERDAARAD